MDELQHFGMQAKAVNRAGFIAVPVLAIAYDGATFGSEMDTDLVGSSGLQMEFDEGINQLTIGRLTRYD